MMDRELEKILDDCISELRKGKSIEECLAQYPEYGLQLKPLLELAQAMERLPAPEPAPEMISATLVSVGQEIARHRKKKNRSVFGILFQQPRFAWALSVVFTMLFGLAGITTVASGSTPSDFLYPVKLVTEKIQFLLTSDGEKRAELRITFSDRRLKEMKSLLERSGTLDTTLLREMLDEAKLALGESKVSRETAPVFLSKLNHFNAYQRDVLEHIRSQVDTTQRELVDEAIEICDMRSSWMRRMMDEEMEQRPIDPQASPRREKRGSTRYEWGPGCDWMR